MMVPCSMVPTMVPCKNPKTYGPPACVTASAAGFRRAAREAVSVSSSVGLENAEDKLRSDSVAEKQKEEKAIMPLSLPLFLCSLPGCVHSLWYIRDLGF